MIALCAKEELDAADLPGDRAGERGESASCPCRAPSRGSRRASLLCSFPLPTRSRHRPCGHEAIPVRGILLAGSEERSVGCELDGGTSAQSQSFLTACRGVLGCAFTGVCVLTRLGRCAHSVRTGDLLGTGQMEAACLGEFLAIFQCLSIAAGEEIISFPSVSQKICPDKQTVRFEFLSSVLIEHQRPPLAVVLSTHMNSREVSWLCPRCGTAQSLTLSPESRCPTDGCFSHSPL